jgi:hypothetical protein
MSVLLHFLELINFPTEYDLTDQEIVHSTEWHK